MPDDFDNAARQAVEPSVFVDDPEKPGHMKSVPLSEAPPMMQPLSTRKPPKRRTSLVAGNNPWDFALNIDGIAVYCKQWSDSLKAWIEDGWPADVAAAVGCSLEVAKSDDKEALKYWVAADQTGKMRESLEALQVAQYDRIITEAVVDWGSPEPCEENKLKMPLALKATVAIDYIRACKFGQRKSDFLS